MTNISTCINKDYEPFINVEYLMNLHPELTKEDAESLKEFSNSKTIEYKECYGDGSIMYPLWKQENKQ